MPCRRARYVHYEGGVPRSRCLAQMDTVGQVLSKEIGNNKFGDINGDTHMYSHLHPCCMYVV
eukprot:1040913-Pyramimonas_sp.AAC.1